MLRNSISKKHRIFIDFSSFLASIWGPKFDKLRLIIATCCPKGSRRHPGTPWEGILPLPGGLFESREGILGLPGVSLKAFWGTWEAFWTILGSCWEANSSKQQKTAANSSRNQQLAANTHKLKRQKTY